MTSLTCGILDLGAVFDYSRTTVRRLTCGEFLTGFPEWLRCWISLYNPVVHLLCTIIICSLETFWTVFQSSNSNLSLLDLFVFVSWRHAASMLVCRLDAYLNTLYVVLVGLGYCLDVWMVNVVAVMQIYVCGFIFVYLDLPFLLNDFVVLQKLLPGPNGIQVSLYHRQTFLWWCKSAVYNK